VTDNLAQSAATGSSSTWVLSNHDVVRHATRYGLEPLNGRAVKQGSAWIIAGAPADQVDLARGSRRALAASLFLLGLPGSTYLYQGEELGLHEVGDIGRGPAGSGVLPRRRPDRDGLGRDGCRVPLPCRHGRRSASAPPARTSRSRRGSPATRSPTEDADPASSLNTYRRALALRHELQTGETLEWIETGATTCCASCGPTAGRS
jgi:alpha-glucosidase